MKMKKLFPPHLSQLVFLNSENEIERINSIDYDLFIWLIYQTHKIYNHTKDTYVEFEYSKVRDSLSSHPNTKSLQTSLEKLDGLQIWSNYLKSYRDKEIIKITPFHIEIISSDNGKSYGFGVKTSKSFLKWFDNPTPNVEVNYNIIYNLKRMSKLLYMFLRDSLGVYESKNRNVKIDKLKHMMNVSRVDTSNSNFITQLKKSIKDVNENSDIEVTHKVLKKKNLKSGKSEIISIKFSIQKDEDKLLKKRCSDTKSILKTDTPNEIPNDTVSVDFTFEDYLHNRVEEEFEKSYHSGVRNSKNFKIGIKKNLINDGIKEEFEIVKLLSTEKEKLKSQITDNQPYMVVISNIDDEYEKFYINNEFKLISMLDNSVVIDSKEEILEFIDGMFGNYYFDIQRCDYNSKYDVVRI